MYKNHEGYTDNTQGEAVNGVRREELQRIREQEHGFKRGDTYTIYIKERAPVGNKHIVKKKRVRIIELYKHVVLIEDSRGIRSAPSYWTFSRMLRME